MMLSMLGSRFIRSDGDRWLIGVCGALYMLLPMPSTGALRAPNEDDLENMERNDRRGLASFRRKSARTASIPSDL